jgi:DNA helicase II / ATP-dependent DNA helicase PcrA
VHTPTSSQRNAIEAPAKPLLVVAGPGSGKTFCLIERIRFLIEKHGVAPERICAFTFTNKAAEEIATRLDELGPKVALVKRTTIHKFCVDVLREHGERIGIRAGFGIADDEYQATLMWKVGASKKNHAQLLQNIARHQLRGDALSPPDERRFLAYAQELRERNMLDFEMLLLRCLDLLRHVPEVSDTVAARWDVILVDEFQDLNRVQYAIVHELARRQQNIFAVGDYDQSIFGWAAAEPGLFETFLNDFRMTQADVIHLVDNWRCPRDIFDLARRLVDINPMLPGLGARAEISPIKEPKHPVQCEGFETAEAEVAWLLADIREQQLRENLRWDDFAVLYRRHELGNVVEATLLNDGIPSRLAHGRALADDPVIAYVNAALGVIAHPSDVAFQDSFLSYVLPRSLMQDVEVEAERKGLSRFVTIKRRYNEASEDGAKIRRAVALLRGFKDLGERHTEIMPLIEELLSRRVGAFKSALEERVFEIDDPELNLEARTLAFRLQPAFKSDTTVTIAPMGGAEIPIKAMLHTIGFRTVHLGAGPRQGALTLTAADGGELGLPLVVFKACQIIVSRKFERALRDYTAVDIESTGLDVKKDEVVQIAAVRVRNGEPVAERAFLVKPSVPIPASASTVHKITDADVANAPTFAEVWPAMCDFWGDDVLVAHNGEKFDFPLLRRQSAALGGRPFPSTIDTMHLTRETRRGSHKLEDIAREFGIDPGDVHNAVDDTRTLAKVFARLEGAKAVRARKTSLSQLLDHLGIALALTETGSDRTETKEFRAAALPYVFGRYSDALSYYRTTSEAYSQLGAPSVQEVVERLGGEEMRERIQKPKNADDRYPAAMQRLRQLLGDAGGATLAEQMQLVLERIALSAKSGPDVVEKGGRVNLLTLHSTKGLEFSRVYIIGVEDALLAAPNAPLSEVEEARRLLYVGMTRAKERLVLTRVEIRNGRPTGGTQFLDEMGLTPARI